MVYWKNRTLNELSRNELQSALIEAINSNFDRQNSNSSNDIYSTFLFGMLTGAAVALAAVSISYL